MKMLRMFAWCFCSFLGGAGSLLASQAKVGVLFASYGDIDAPEEAEAYVKAAILDPDIAPIPNLLRPLVASVGWSMTGEATKEEYRRIGGGTQYRAAARQQAQLVVEALGKQGLSAKAYTGFVFVAPHIVETMAQVQADGITDLIVFNQGAQYSAVTQGINFREVRRYLGQHPEWKVQVTGVRSFSDDPRFVELMAQSVEAGIAQNFAQTPAEELCLLFPLHGVPSKLPEQGDPAIPQMLRLVDAMRARFSEYPIFYGFQNHDEFPGSQWVQPKVEAVAADMANDPRCKSVLIDGRGSFTIDNLETFYDQGVTQREILEQGNPQIKIAVSPMFNSELAFVELMATLSREALQGKGDLERLH